MGELQMVHKRSEAGVVECWNWKKTIWSRVLRVCCHCTMTQKGVKTCRKSDGKRLQYSFLPIRNFRWHRLAFGLRAEGSSRQRNCHKEGCFSFWMEGFGKEEMIQTMFAIWSERFEPCHNTLMPSNTWHDVTAQSGLGSRSQSWWVSRLLCFALELRAHVPRSVFQTFQEIHNVEDKEEKHRKNHYIERFEWTE